MKKLMSIMLALALTTGVATVTLAQDKGGDDTKKGTKKGKAKKAKDGDGKDAKDGKGGKGGKGGKKGKDGDTK